LGSGNTCGATIAMVDNGYFLVEGVNLDGMGDASRTGNGHSKKCEQFVVSTCRVKW
jgi:hypothetical protein